jgi:hypothetical protein
MVLDRGGVLLAGIQAIGLRRCERFGRDSDLKKERKAPHGAGRFHDG